MSEPQTIKTESGEELVVLTRRDYDAMLARAGDEDAEDRMTARIVKEARARGDVALPIAVWRKIEAAPSPIGPLREWRGLTQEALAEAAHISQPYLSMLESGRKNGNIATLRAIAQALRVGLEDVAQDDGGSTPTPASLHVLVRSPRDAFADEEERAVAFYLFDANLKNEVMARCQFEVIKRLGNARVWNEQKVMFTFYKFRESIEAVAERKYVNGDREPTITINDLPAINETHSAL